MLLLVGHHHHHHLRDVLPPMRTPRHQTAERENENDDDLVESPGWNILLENLVKIYGASLVRFPTLASDVVLLPLEPAARWKTIATQ